MPATARWHVALRRGLTGRRLLGRLPDDTLIDRKIADPLARADHALKPANRSDRVKEAVDKPTTNAEQACATPRARQQMRRERMAADHLRSVRPNVRCANRLPIPLTWATMAPRIGRRCGLLGGSVPAESAEMGRLAARAHPRIPARCLKNSVPQHGFKRGGNAKRASKARCSDVLAEGASVEQQAFMRISESILARPPICTSILQRAWKVRSDSVWAARSGPVQTPARSGRSHAFKLRAATVLLRPGAPGRASSRDRKGHLLTARQT